MIVSQSALQQLLLAIRRLSIMKVEPNPVAKTVPTSTGGFTVDTVTISAGAKVLSEALAESQL